ncbi:hypothetical protein BH20ACI1_BH20ACI1_05190 [soil metagenome]
MDKYCQNCNTQNSPDAIFCRHCAAPFTASGQQADANQAQFGNQQRFPQNVGNQPVQNFAQNSSGASGRAIAATVLAVCGLLLCCGPFTGIPGAILGWMEMTAIKEGKSSLNGMLWAQIGLWGGIASSVIGGFINILMSFSILSGGMY